MTLQKKFYKWRLWLSILLQFVLLVKMLDTNTVVHRTEWEEMAQDMETKYRIRIIFEPLVFPSDWLSNCPQWTAVQPENRLDALVSLDFDLAKYNPDFLVRHLSRVYIFQSLSFMKTPYGGTNDYRHKWLYLHENWLGDTGVNQNAAGFHHELSSIVFNMHRAEFQEDIWRSVNANGFDYAMEGASYEKLHSGRTSTIGNPRVYAEGFICEYGQLALEEDINTYAEYLIAKPDALEQLKQTYPLIHRKATLLNDFYHRLGFQIQATR